MKTTRALVALLVVVCSASVASAQDLDAGAPAPEALPDAGPPAEESLPSAGETPAPAAVSDDEQAILAGSPCAVEDIRTLTAYRAGPAANGAKVSGYTLRPSTDLLESERVLRPVLDSLILGQPYDEKRERCLVGLLTKLLYRLDGPIRGQKKDGGWWLTVPIHAAVVVSSIDIDAYFPGALGLNTYLWPPILEQDMLVHTKLRVGTLVPDDEQTRANFLSAEARELEDWLGRQGYFDARVEVVVEEGEREHEIEVKLEVVAGERYKTGAIRVVGNKAIPKDEIVALVAADKFSKEKLNKGLERVRRLYQSKGFPAVRVTSDFDPTTSPNRARHAVDFTVNIKEGRRLEYVFEGYEWPQKDELEEVLTFDDNGAADDEEAQNSADAVRTFYQRNGFFQAVATWARVTRIPRVFDRIIIRVVEGPRFRVASVGYKGNEQIATSRLSGATVTTTYSRWRSGGYVTTLQLAQDVEAIRELYRSEGFADVVVTPRLAPRRELLDAPGALHAYTTGASGDMDLHVRFDIEEGERNVVAAVDFDGNTELSDGQLAGLITLRPGKPYSQAQLKDDLEKLRTHYSANGYAYVKIDAAALRPEEHRFRIRFTIVEGPAIKMGKVIVRGNFRTRRWVLRTVLNLDEDEVVTVEGLRDGQEALRSSGLFQAVNVELLGLAPEQRWERVHALVTVQESTQDIINGAFFGGYSDLAKTFAGAEVAFPNIYGTGVRIDGSATAGIQGYWLGTATLRIPWWIQRRYWRTPARLSPDVTIGINDSNTTHPRFGDLEQTTVFVQLSRQITRRLFGQLRWEASRKGLVEELVRGPGGAEGRETGPIDYAITTTTLSLAYDARTDRHGTPTPIGATDGYKISGYAELASDLAIGALTLGREEFFKVGAAYVNPTSFGKGRTVLTLGLRFDHGYSFDSSVLPETERFFAGGDLTLRGYEEGRAFTEVIRSPLPGGGEVLTVEEAGGNERMLGNLDFELRICNCVGGLPLASAVFLDVGLVSNSLDALKLSPVWWPFPEGTRYSIGVALARIVTPVVSLSLEYAIPINPGVGDDQTGRVHVNFGFVVN